MRQVFACRPIIGIVGGIGAGKSQVARLFEQAGCCRIASDEMIRAAYTHPQVKRQVVERFGEQVIDEGGRIDRKRIADIVFRNIDERRWLERLLHPVANAARVELMEEAAKDERVTGFVWDSPLLLETGLNRLCDAVVFVDAPWEDRLRRVAERGWDEAELRRREGAQMALDKKRRIADHELRNADAAPATAGDVEALLGRIVKDSGEGAAGCAEGCGAGSPPGRKGGVPCACGDAGAFPAKEGPARESAGRRGRADGE